MLLYTTEECQIVGKQFSMGEELCHLDDVGMRMHFIPYRKTFSHNLALLRPLNTILMTTFIVFVLQISQQFKLSYLGEGKVDPIVHGLLIPGSPVKVGFTDRNWTSWYSVPVFSLYYQPAMDIPKFQEMDIPKFQEKVTNMCNMKKKKVCSSMRDVKIWIVFKLAMTDSENFCV